VFPASRDSAKNEVWRRKWGPLLTWISPLVVLFGLAQLSGVLK
jgi:hypothetical protein